MSYRIGIDVGGTHTDAALLDESLRCLSTVKVVTTPDVTSGIHNALAKLLRASEVSRDAIQHVMLGTTHCTNALVERRSLLPVGLLRLANPAALALPPLSGWPQDLVQALDARIATVNGGYEYDGRVLNELDEAQIRSVVRGWKGQLESVAICGMFSPVNATQELRVGQWVREELGERVRLSFSSEIGNVGLLERESATVLNAALGGVADVIANGFREALAASGLSHAQALIGQNDGTLMSLDLTRAYPVFTTGCGPTNSLRGAAFLSGNPDALVIDVGGTTTDIGALVRGFPRESALAVEIGGVRTNFRMPDILSIGIGGGTIVRAADGHVKLGPDSVGYRLTHEAQCFGGETLTLTDVAIRLAIAPAFADGPIRAERSVCEQAFAAMLRALEDGIDRMKSRAGDVPVILVGGGSVLVPDRLQGASQVIRPEHFDAANAIGVAIGGVGGIVDRVVQLPPDTRQATLNGLLEEARGQAIAEGADAAHLEVIEQEIVPLAYLPGNGARVRVKVAGPLRIDTH